MTIFHRPYCYKFIFSILIILSQICTISANISAKLRLSVTGNGFHRILQYDVYVHNLTLEKCHVAMHLQLSSALYVNTDELADLRRTAVNIACSVGENDIELIAEKAKSQNVTLCGPLTQGSCQLELPVHQRYHYAEQGGNYANVSLPAPKILLGCRGRIRDYRVSKINLCSPCSDFVPKWREIPYVFDEDSYAEWQVPIGDSKLQTYVTYATLLVTIFGTFFVVRAISRVTMEDHMKRD